MADVEFRAFSQTGEDGLLLFVLTSIGFTNRYVVELGCGDGRECNTANLIINHGCHGLLVDGNPELVAIGRHFYGESKDTRIWPPRLVSAFISCQNVNSLLRENGAQGEIDLLSIDLDGVDFWIWESLDAVSPRVVMVEANNIWGATETVAVPYDAHFVADIVNGAPDYSGASLAAFAKLASRKGYRLVGAQSYGFNAVFVRNDIAPHLLPAVSVSSCLEHPQSAHARTVRNAAIEARPLVQID